MITLGNIYPNGEGGSEESSDSNQKKRKFLIITVASGALILFLVYLVFCWYQDKPVDEVTTTTEQNQPTEPTLTETELEAERQLLPTYKTVNLPKTAGPDKTKNSPSGTASIISDSEVDAKIAESKKPSQQSSSAPEGTKSVSVSQPTSPTAKTDANATVYINPASDVKVSGVSVDYAKADRTLSKQEREGTVHSINLAENYLLIISSTDIIKIGLTSQTKVSINNKKIGPSDLLIGDVLHIEGQGYNNVNELTAESIAIIAKLELITNTD